MVQGNSGASDIGGRSGEFGMGCNCVCGVCHGVSGNGGIHWQKGGTSCCKGWMGVQCVPFGTAAAPVMVEMAP